MTQDTYERAREALSFIPPEDRDVWVRMAMAIKSEFADTGFDLWDEWSRGAENYNAAAAKSVWKGIKEAGRITIASLFYEAKQNGWTPGGSYQPREMNDDERGERERRMREAEEQRKQENARAKEHGRLLYKHAGSPNSHVYLKERKHVEPTETLRQIPLAIACKILGYEPQANEEKLVGNLLVVPLKAGADFVGVELIDSDGRKTVPFGTATKGAYWSPESLPDGDGAGRRVLIGEGVATMLSARAAFPGDVCIAGRFAGNLPAVGEAMRRLYPQARIVILGERGGGWKFAVRAAQLAGALLADFGSDANDVHQAQGLDAVRVVIGAAQEPPQEALQDARPVADVSQGQPEAENAPTAVLAPFVKTMRGDEIELRPIGWVWNGFLPKGKVVLVGGQPGTGKTTLAINLGAIVSRGTDFPDRSRAQVGDVLVWSGEDSIADTLAGRFKAAGADMARVHFVDSVRTPDGKGRAFDPSQDIDALYGTARAIPALRIVIVDPIVSAVQGDSHKNAEVRRSLQPLVDFAERTSAVVLGITHFSKGTQGREPIERITGSLAFAALARVVLVCAKVDDSNGGGRVMVRSKSNLGPDGGGFKYDLEVIEVQAGIEASRVKWGEPIEGTAREILANAEESPEVGEHEETQGATEWLREALRTGELGKAEIMRQAEGAGFSASSIHRARKRLGVIPAITGFGINKRSIWKLRPDRPIVSEEPENPQSCQSFQPFKVDTIDTNGGTNGVSPPYSDRIPWEEPTPQLVPEASPSLDTEAL